MRGARALLAEAAAAAAALRPHAAIVALRHILDSTQMLGADWAKVIALATHLQDDDLAVAAAQRQYAELGGREAAMVLAGALATAGLAHESAKLLTEWKARGALAANELFLFARQLSFSNRLEEAEEELRGLIRAHPKNPFGWEVLAQCKTFRSGDADVTAMQSLRRLLEGAPPAARAAIHYALGKAYVDLGDDAGAAGAFRNAAAARREIATYDLSSIGEAERKAVALIENDALLGPSPPSSLGEDVVFILGAPRSGTTLVEQILSRRARTHAGGEVKFMWLASREMNGLKSEALASVLGADQVAAWLAMGERYLEFVRRRVGGGVMFTDKLLSNYLRLGFIKRALPAARVLWCRRNALDVAWSCWRTNFSAEMSWSNDPDLIAHFIASYERVLSCWRDRTDGKLLVVQYEDLVSDPDRQIPNLIAQFGLDDDGEITHPHEADRSVVTSSFAQVRSPISRSRVAAADAFPRATADLRQALQKLGMI